MTRVIGAGIYGVRVEHTFDCDNKAVGERGAGGSKNSESISIE